jgi:hypothetical protein
LRFRGANAQPALSVAICTAASAGKPDGVIVVGALTEARAADEDNDPDVGPPACCAVHPADKIASRPSATPKGLFLIGHSTQGPAIWIRGHSDSDPA